MIQSSNVMDAADARGLSCGVILTDDHVQVSIVTPNGTSRAFKAPIDADVAEIASWMDWEMAK